MLKAMIDDYFCGEPSDLYLIAQKLLSESESRFVETLDEHQKAEYLKLDDKRTSLSTILQEEKLKGFWSDWFVN